MGMHTAKATSNAFSATRKRRCLDARQEVQETLMGTTTAPNLYCRIWGALPTRRGSWMYAKATATLTHTAKPASNAFSANRLRRCLDARQEVQETLMGTTTATNLHCRMWRSLLPP